jgi:3-methyladenine DNA glycosylase AlkC
VPEPFKELISRDFIKKLSEALEESRPGFAGRAFVSSACPRGFGELGLMDRVSRVAEALGAHLLGEGSWRGALDSLFAVHPRFGGLPGFVFPRFVAMFGMTPERFDVSMDALSRFTVGSSSEFGVRPFIREDPARAFAHIRRWAESADDQVRRLATEGSRPRLPWGGSIPDFVKDPSPVLELVEGLLEDPSLFVRKSCGNSLNDVSKDSPGLFMEFARKHLGEGGRTDWILRRGARTLIKKKHPGALKLFGYAQVSFDGGDGGDTGASGKPGKVGRGGASGKPGKAGRGGEAGKPGKAGRGGEAGKPGKPASSAKPRVIGSAVLEASPAEIRIGSSVELRYRVELARSFGGLVRLEYRVTYPASPGRPARQKLFFLREKDMEKGASIEGVRKAAFKDLSIRKQVTGEHLIELAVNGLYVAKAAIRLRR